MFFLVSDKNKVPKIIARIFIDALKEGNAIWNSPYVLSDFTNFATKTRYKGLTNRMLLANSMEINHFTNPLFITFKQLSEKGYRLKEGSHGTIITYWGEIKKKTKNEKDVDNDKDEKRNLFDDAIRFLRFYKVFNVQQIENYREIPKIQNLIDEIRNKKNVVLDKDKIYQMYPNPKPKLKTSNLETPHYNPTYDVISMPSLKNFFGSRKNLDFTFYHELTHSTGIASRLKRYDIKDFDNKKRGLEELVAEIGASLLFAYQREKIPDDILYNAKAYIKGWIKPLEDNPKMILIATALADKSTKYILGEK